MQITNCIGNGPGCQRPGSAALDQDFHFQDLLNDLLTGASGVVRGRWQKKNLPNEEGGGGGKVSEQSLLFQKTKMEILEQKTPAQGLHIGTQVGQS